MRVCVREWGLQIVPENEQDQTFIRDTLRLTDTDKRSVGVQKYNGHVDHLAIRGE